MLGMHNYLQFCDLIPACLTSNFHSVKLLLKKAVYRVTFHEAFFVTQVKHEPPDIPKINLLRRYRTRK